MKELSLLGNTTLCPAIALIRGTEILIGLRHYTPDKWKHISVWTIPGGRSDDGETIEITLRREVAEEIGVTDFDISHFLGTVDGAKEGDIVYLFAGSTSQEPQNIEPEKFSEWAWVDINKIPENFINPKLLMMIKDFLQQ